jgi:hypothetical protein
VELLEIRKHGGLLPQDWLPGKILMLSRCRDANDQQPGWRFSVHESGNSQLTVDPAFSERPQRQMRWNQIPIPVEAAESGELIREAIDLPKQLPEDCIEWNSEFIEMQAGGAMIRDRRNGARCMVLQVMESGRSVLIIGIHEDSLKVRESRFYRTIERLIRPHLYSDPASL